MSLAWADVGGVGKITAHDLGTPSVSGTYSVSADLTATENDKTGDDDYFKFTLENPATIVISSSSTIDTYGTLLDDNLDDKKNEIASNDDAFLTPNNRDFKIERVLSAGTYYVWVRPYFKGITGNYQLSIALVFFPDEAGDTPSTAKVISPLAPSVGYVLIPSAETKCSLCRLTAEDVDLFKIVIPANRRSTGNFQGVLHAYTTGTTDTWIEILHADANGDLNILSSAANGEAKDDNAGENYNALLNYPINGSGTTFTEPLGDQVIYIKVRGSAPSTTGTYNLHVIYGGGGIEALYEGGPTIANYAPWRPMAVSDGSINNGFLSSNWLSIGDVDVYQITANAPIKRGTFTWKMWSWLDLEVQLLSSSGAVLASTTNGSSSTRTLANLQFTFHFNVVEGQTYYLLIKSRNTVDNLYAPARGVYEGDLEHRY